MVPFGSTPTCGTVEENVLVVVEIVVEVFIDVDGKMDEDADFEVIVVVEANVVRSALVVELFFCVVDGVVDMARLQTYGRAGFTQSASFQRSDSSSMSKPKATHCSFPLKLFGSPK
jgi:hypothetical protein